jgi:O-antigen biosynthesis protein
LADFLVENKSLITTLSDIETTEAVRPPSYGSLFVRRLGASVPRAWVPGALRGLSGAAAHLPATLRGGLHRVLRFMRSEMGAVELEYPAWIDLYDRVDADARRGIMANIVRMPNPPLISVLMPVFNPPPEHLRAAIHSVQDQFYPWWQLCICDDASTDPAVTEILRDAVLRDPRIKLVRRAQNGHISAASNSALQLATGRYVALLDHDDLLPPHALHDVAARIAAQPNVDIIYSDEDHIDDAGTRSHPYFKPDWNPELMLGQNLISHLGVYRRTLVEYIGGFRTGFEGSQDYDLALRMVAETRADRIAHIPKVLYHWRQGAADRTFSEAAHDRCVQNGRRAVYAFVTRDQDEARVEPAPFAADWTRVVYPVPEPAPLVSVIVSCERSADALSDCIEALLNRTDYPALEVLVPVDKDLALTPDERVRCIEGRHSPRTNTVVEQARGSLVLLLDCHLNPNDPGWLREMVSHAVRPGVGAVGAKLLCPEGMVRHAGIAVGGRGVAFMPFAGRGRTQTGYFGHLQLARDVTAVSGACLMVRREAFQAVGGLDEILSLTGFSDVDLCLKLADIGYRIVWTPYAELSFRDDGPTQRDHLYERAAVRMRQRWGKKLDADRYWSPNLSPEPAAVTLAFPPRTGRFAADRLRSDERGGMRAAV